MRFQLRRGPTWLRRAWLVVSVLVIVPASVPLALVIAVGQGVMEWLRYVAIDLPRELRWLVPEEWRLAGSERRGAAGGGHGGT